MTPPVPWHPAEEQLQSYVDGGVLGLSAASVETHLLSCAGCRSLVRAAVDTRRLSSVKLHIDDRLDREQRPRVERLLVRLGVDDADARALLAAPSLRRAWWLAVAGAAVLALLVSRNDSYPHAMFLALAPLVPLVATGAAYAPSLDEAFALVAATPYSLVRLMLARSLAVGCTALVGVLLASVALPGWHASSVAWMLPAVALTLGVLVLSERVGAELATVTVSALWLTTIGVLEQSGRDTDWVATAGTQVAAAAIVVVGVAVLARQWSGLQLRGNA